MNAAIKNLSYDKLLFMDLEMSSGLKSLEEDKELFKIFQYKNRDRETDKLPTKAETLALYNRKAALDPVTGQIVCGVVGLVAKDEIRLLSFKGNEKDVVQSMIDTFNKSNNRILIGFNQISYDLPYLRKRASILGCTGYPEAINDVGAKPWVLSEKLVDLMTVFKGTGFYNNNLEELCWAYGILSPKDTGVKGVEVSKVFWEGGIDKIELYCCHDVVATINLFRKMKGDNIIDYDFTSAV